MPSVAEVDRSQFVLPNDQPFVTLDAKPAFEGLGKREQLYAHYISRASFYGGLIVLIQTSPESPQIFRLIHAINTAQKSSDLKELATKNGVSEEDFTAYIVYCTGIYSNMGNYKGFGDSKMVPNLPQEQFEAIVNSSKNGAELMQLWNEVKAKMYSLSKAENQLGLGCNGISTYFSENCDHSDAEKIKEYFKHKGLEGYINRAFKTVGADGKATYEIKNAGIEEKVLSEEVYEGSTFLVTTGDYAPLLKLVNENLEQAASHAANDNEKSMLLDYVKSFKEGSLEAHKNGSRHWIKNKGPAVETYIGFIETYRDPSGMRGEFEGFVAMVNKEQSAKFQALVEMAEEILPRLPWPKEFEKDKFLKPDFTSLDVLSFSGSGIPAGINIPNYDEIRQSEGFKNVNLGNVVASAYKADDKKKTFVSNEDSDFLKKWTVPSFELQVGLHELLGHGSGKLFKKENDSLNFDEGLQNPLTSKAVGSYYKVGETYDSKFGAFGSAYEECRAEAVGIYLSTYKDICKVFGYVDDKEADDVIYANWLSLLHAGVKSLEMYSPETKEWKQAHSRARFAILQVLLEAGEGFVDVKEVKGEDGSPDLLLTVDKGKLISVGKPAIGEFLTKLQVYKSTGDSVNAKTLFDGLTEVKEEGKHPFGKWRQIIMARKVPRKMKVQPNTILKDEALTFKEYSSTAEGMIQSWTERFDAEEFQTLGGILKELHLKDAPHFQSKA